MKIIQSVFVSLLLLILANQAFSEKMLVPDNSETPECKYSYDNALQPKTDENVLSAMTQICIERGGMHVLHKILTSESSDEPTGVIFTCIGENPNLVIFNCMFSTSYGDL
ncbi:hypothetical protein EP47_14335 [Legionella norrlandica]|uniref:Uncharacterized protein n=1 Tax=Legionella norrlandica TaxID=1498499 RepID=A0A0A2T5Z9_9GAMM|nr:hypothetical protein [Legionella norrlandica]KGP62853.1 hypothetical protein EP47_14335 [Legionella norrlandica]